MLFSRNVDIALLKHYLKLLQSILITITYNKENQLQQYIKN